MVKNVLLDLRCFLGPIIKVNILRHKPVFDLLSTGFFNH